MVTNKRLTTLFIFGVFILLSFSLALADDFIPVDEDGDGFLTNVDEDHILYDHCPGTERGALVDDYGCSCEQKMAEDCDAPACCDEGQVCIERAGRAFCIDGESASQGEPCAVEDVYCERGLECKEDIYASYYDDLSSYICCPPNRCAGEGDCVSEGRLGITEEGIKECVGGVWLGIEERVENICPDNELISNNLPCQCGDETFFEGHSYGAEQTSVNNYCCDNEISEVPCHEEYDIVTCRDEEIGETVTSGGNDYEVVDDQTLREAINDHERVCTSHVTDMSWLFRYDADYLNEFDISNWDVGNVENMRAMFYNVGAFNQDISRWDVSNVERMDWMFRGADSFNQDIGRWDVSNVENMRGMFTIARSFNQDIGAWNVGNVEDMSVMFWGAESFNHDLSDWNVGGVESYTRFDHDADRWREDYKPNFEVVDDFTLTSPEDVDWSCISEEEISYRGDHPDIELGSRATTKIEVKAPDEEAHEKEEIIQTLETDKETYEHDETIGMTLFLENPIEEEVVLHSGSTCSKHYSFAGEEYINAMGGWVNAERDDIACTAEGLIIEIPPNDNVEFELEHDLEEKPVGEGTYEIEAWKSIGELGPKGTAEIEVESPDEVTYPTGVEVDLEIEETSYTLEDKIDITISAYNPLEQDITLEIGEMTSPYYRIGGEFDSRPEIAHYGLQHVDLPAGETKEWSKTHDLEEDPVPVGTYNLSARVGKYGSDSTEIEIGTEDKIIQTLETNKETYHNDERIELQLTLENPTEEDVVIEGGGCRGEYLLGDTLYATSTVGGVGMPEGEAVCTADLYYWPLGAGETREITMIHDLSSYSLEEGEHKIEAGKKGGSVLEVEEESEIMEISWEGAEGFEEIRVLARTGSYTFNLGTVDDPSASGSYDWVVGESAGGQLSPDRAYSIILRGNGEEVRSDSFLLFNCEDMPPKEWLDAPPEESEVFSITEPDEIEEEICSDGGSIDVSWEGAQDFDEVRVGLDTRYDQNYLAQFYPSWGAPGSGHGSYEIDIDELPEGSEYSIFVEGRYHFDEDEELSTDRFSVVDCSCDDLSEEECEASPGCSPVYEEIISWWYFPDLMRFFGVTVEEYIVCVGYIVECEDQDVGDTIIVEDEEYEVVDDNTIGDAIENEERVCTSHVTDMERLFRWDHTNEYLREMDISDWDVSNVENMRSMFRDAESFNQNISNWDVSNVEEVNSMFQNAESFNQDLSDWCFEKIEDRTASFDMGADNWVKPSPSWGEDCDVECSGEILTEDLVSELNLDILEGAQEAVTTRFENRLDEGTLTIEGIYETLHQADLDAEFTEDEVISVVEGSECSSEVIMCSGKILTEELISDLDFDYMPDGVRGTLAEWFQGKINEDSLTIEDVDRAFRLTYPRARFSKEEVISVVEDSECSSEVIMCSGEILTEDLISGLNLQLTEAQEELTSARLQNSFEEDDLTIGDIYGYLESVKPDSDFTEEEVISVVEDSECSSEVIMCSGEILTEDLVSELNLDILEGAQEAVTTRFQKRMDEDTLTIDYIYGLIQDTSPHEELTEEKVISVVEDSECSSVLR